MSPSNSHEKLLPDIVADNIRNTLLEKISLIQGVVSVSIVGSFSEKNDLAAISDIDTIVVVEELEATVFNNVRNAITDIDPATLGLDGYSIIINDTFGPRKFNTVGKLVIHLMVYDLAGHREHVLKSPFTCLDWERTERYKGKSLRGSYPTLFLQPADFFNARRGLQNYIDDLSENTLSYRYYDISADGSMREVLAKESLDTRHAGEYAFHIIKFLVGNYAKLITGKNQRLQGEVFSGFWKEYLPGCASFLPFYLQLELLKSQGATGYPADTVAHVKAFLAAYEKEIQAQWYSEARTLFFVRHAKTPMNDGSFLGQGRDPGILDGESIMPFAGEIHTVFTSPMRRAMESATYFCPGKTPVTDKRLNEIEYGAAEGKTFQELQSLFPEIVKAWEDGQDARFPEGENSLDVAARLQDFLHEWAHSGPGNDLVITHNVVIRVLLGSLLQVPVHQWYRIEVPHLEPLQIQWFRGKFYLNISADLRARITDSLIGWKNPVRFAS